MKNIIEYSLVDSITDISYISFDKDMNMFCKGEYMSTPEVLRYYDKKFKVYNSRYVNIHGSREFAKANLHKAVLVTQHLNPSINEADLRRWIRSKIKKFSGETLIKSIEAGRFAKEWFGQEYNVEDIQSETSIQWQSRFPSDNPFDSVEECEKHFEYIVKARQKFSLACHNKVKSKESLDRYYAAYDTISNDYGCVSMFDVADLMGVTIGTVKRLKSKVDRLSNIDRPIPVFGNKKYIDTQRRIVSTGEEVHYSDKEFITKQKIHNKSKIGRPTINSHWGVVNEYFEELNKMLEDEK